MVLSDVICISKTYLELRILAVQTLSRSLLGLPTKEASLYQIIVIIRGISFFITWMDSGRIPLIL